MSLDVTHFLTAAICFLFPFLGAAVTSVLAIQITTITDVNAPQGAQWSLISCLPSGQERPLVRP